MPKRRGFATIWDGIAYRQVSHEEAEKLEKEDKCQNLSHRMFGATELKFRRDFTGYKTREMRAAEPAPAPVAEPEIPPLAPAPESTAVDPADWKDYKSDAADDLGQAWNKTTKVQTLAYMEKYFGLATP